jgi:hypothetical protein
MRPLIAMAVVNLLAVSDYAVAKGGFVRTPAPVPITSMMIHKKKPKPGPQKGRPAVTPPG